MLSFVGGSAANTSLPPLMVLNEPAPKSGACAGQINSESQSKFTGVGHHSFDRFVPTIDHSQLVYLEKVLGETQVRGQAPLDKIAWNWPTR